MQLLSAVDVKDLPPPSYLIDPILPAGGLAVLFGRSSIGKTFVALDMALCVATGTDWLDGYPVKKGTAVYVMAEGTGGLGRRIRAWEIAHSIAINADARFVPEPVQLKDPQEVKKFIALLKQLPGDPAPVLVVIDTLARCFLGGEENSAKDMGLFIAGGDAIRKATSATVLVIHHPGRKEDHERGSTALRGAADVVMVTEPHPMTNGRWLKCEKPPRDGEPFAPIAFCLKTFELGEGHTSCVVRATDSAGWPKLSAATWTKATGALKGFPHGITFTEWQQASGLPKTTFWRAIKALVTQKIVEKKNGKYFVVTQETA